MHLSNGTQQAPQCAHILRGEISWLIHLVSAVWVRSSPPSLQNNLSEYHTMLAWIAPNFIWDAATFREDFVKVIEAGEACALCGFGVYTYVYRPGALGKWEALPT